MEQSKIPANVALYLRQEIERRTNYKIEMETRVHPPTFDLAQTRRYQADMPRLQENMAKILRDILPIVKQYMPEVVISDNDELTISNILTELPPPEELVVKKVFHGGE